MSVTPEALFQFPNCSNTDLYVGMRFHRILQRFVAILLELGNRGQAELDNVALVSDQLRELVDLIRTPGLKSEPI